MLSLIPFLIDSIFIGYLFTGVVLWFGGRYLPGRFPLSAIITYNNLLALMRAVAILAFMLLRLFGNSTAESPHWSLWVLLLLEAGAPLVMIKSSYRNTLKGTHLVMGAWALSALISWGIALSAGEMTSGFALVPFALKLAAHLLLLVFIYIGVTLFKGFD